MSWTSQNQDVDPRASDWSGAPRSPKVAREYVYLIAPPAPPPTQPYSHHKFLPLVNADSSTLPRERAAPPPATLAGTASVRSVFKLPRPAKSKGSGTDIASWDTLVDMDLANSPAAERAPTRPFASAVANWRAGWREGVDSSANAQGPRYSLPSGLVPSHEELFSSELANRPEEAGAFSRDDETSTGADNLNVLASANESAQPQKRQRRRTEESLQSYNHRKHKCEACDKRFSRPSGLTTHLVSHTKEKLHVCGVCLSSHGTPSNLKRHILSQHTPSGPERRC